MFLYQKILTLQMHSLLYWMNTIKKSCSHKIVIILTVVLDKVPLHKYLQSQSKSCCNDNTFKVYNTPIVLTLTFIMDEVPLHKFFHLPFIYFCFSLSVKITIDQRYKTNKFKSLKCPMKSHYQIWWIIFHWIFL